jgi:hypothetical protein
MMFRFVFWDVLPCKIIVDRRFIALMMEAARTSETQVDNYFTRQYITQVKVKQSRYTPWRRLGGEDV